MPAVLSLKPILKCPPRLASKGLHKRRRASHHPAPTLGKDGASSSGALKEGRETGRDRRKRLLSPRICRTLSETMHTEWAGAAFFFWSLNSQCREKRCFSSLCRLSRPAPLSAPLCGCILPCRTPHFSANFTPPRRFNEQPRVSSQRGPLPAHPQNMPS